MLSADLGWIGALSLSLLTGVGRRDIKVEVATPCALPPNVAGATPRAVAAAGQRSRASVTAHGVRLLLS